MAQRAVVELEVVEEAHLLIAAVFAHKLALVFVFVDTAALQRNPFVSNMSWSFYLALTWVGSTTHFEILETDLLELCSAPCPLDEPPEAVPIGGCGGGWVC